MNDYRIFDQLNLNYAPIGIKYGFFRPDGIEPLENDAHLSLCEMLKKSQSENKAFYFSRENDETCVGKILLGMEEMEPFAESGQIGVRLGVFEDARANQHLYQYIPRIDKDIVNFVSFSPVNQMKYDPDVLLITADPSNAEIIMRAASYSTGMVYSSTCTPVMGCSWFLIYPYQTGKINYVIPSLVHGPHGRELYDPNDIIISIPYQWIPTILQNLNNMQLHLPSHESKKAYYDEFHMILGDLAKESNEIFGAK